jgi:hypothetical protein
MEPERGVVPTAAKERAPHGEEDEVLRLHLPQTLRSLEDGSRTVSLGEAPSKPVRAPRSYVTRQGLAAPMSYPIESPL